MGSIFTVGKENQQFWFFYNFDNPAYIYMVPVITVTASALILREQITVPAIMGTILTLAGLLLSDMKFNFKKRGKTNECRK